MDFVTLFLIAVGLSADCFAVALSAGCSIKTPSPSQVLRTSLAFGIFQTLMSLLGWLAGRVVLGLIANYDHWVAFGLLAFVGGRMLWGSFRPQKHQRQDDITRGVSLLILSVATSMDALAVGLSFALLAINIAIASSIIGVVALAVTATGFMVGRKAGDLMGKRAETAGGIILIAIGLRILLSHLLQ
ncbi:MAG: manganese efflux pump MntP family protein [Dehalococcoidales bacterium]|nr:manganese efflux pump MntP family protein [Dehalococcoidales bacterium]